MGECCIRSCQANSILSEVKTMEVMEIAAMLGAKIKEDARIIRLNDARAKYEQDTDMMTAMVEYNAQQTALTEEYKKAEADKDIIAAIEKRLEELYTKITTSAAFIEYNAAQEEVNAFMNEVNEEITYQITGERPCTHDCSNCGSDCGHHHH